MKGLNTNDMYKKSEFAAKLKRFIDDNEKSYLDIFEALHVNILEDYRVEQEFTISDFVKHFEKLDANGIKIYKKAVEIIKDPVELTMCLLHVIVQTNAAILELYEGKDYNDDEDEELDFNFEAFKESYFNIKKEKPKNTAKISINFELDKDDKTRNNIINFKDFLNDIMKDKE